MKRKEEFDKAAAVLSAAMVEAMEARVALELAKDALAAAGARYDRAFAAQQNATASLERVVKNHMGEGSSAPQREAWDRK